MKNIDKESLRRRFLAGIITESELSEKSIIDVPSPITLSKAASNVNLAKDVASDGHEDGNPKDDVVAGAKPTIPVKDLHAGQTQLIKEKSFGMAINFLLKGNWDGQDFGNIVSNDNYIMDGHHRWASVCLINPKAVAKVTKIDLPGVSLVSALNLITVGEKGITKGNQGRGSVAEFTSQNLKPIVDSAVVNGVTGDFPIAAKDIQRALANMPGANGNYQTGAQLMIRNADALPKQVMPGAPERIDMPVINSDEVAGVADRFAKGEYDIKEPHSQDVLSKSGQQVAPIEEPAQQLSEIRNIIREEIYGVMQEMGEEDPVKLAQDMIKSNEEQVKSLEDELKYREADSRVSNLPRDMKDARVAQAKLTKDRLEKAKQELELSKQSQVNAVKFSQMQTDTSAQTQTSSQISPQT